MIDSDGCRALAEWVAGGGAASKNEAYHARSLILLLLRWEAAFRQELLYSFETPYKNDKAYSV